MSTQDIKDLVAAKIAGQGSQVDIGGALADVINALCDAVDAAANTPFIVSATVRDDSDVSSYDCTLHTSREEVFNAFKSGRIPFVNITYIYNDGFDETIYHYYQEADYIFNDYNDLEGSIYLNFPAIDPLKSGTEIFPENYKYDE